MNGNPARRRPDHCLALASRLLVMGLGLLAAGASPAGANGTETEYPVANPVECNLEEPHAVLHQFSLDDPKFISGFHVAVCKDVMNFENSTINGDKVNGVTVENGAVVLISERPGDHKKYPGNFVVTSIDIPNLRPNKLNDKVSSIQFLPPGTTISSSGMYATTWGSGKKGAWGGIVDTLVKAGKVVVPVIK